MAFNVFKSTDIDAPQMASIGGSLITVLDACLVNGYGTGGNTKAPLGWTKEFAALNKAIYKMGGGSMQLLKIDDGNPINTTELRALSNATSMTDYASMWGTGGYIVKPDSSGIAPLHWMVIGDEKGAYILTKRINNGDVWNIVYFGDIDSYDTSNPNRCLIMPQPSLSDGTVSSSYAPLLTQYSSPKTNFNIKIGSGQETNVVQTFAETYAMSTNDFHIDSFLGKGIVTTKVQIVSETYPKDSPYGTLRGIRQAMNERQYLDFLFKVVNPINGSGSDAGKTFLPIAIPDGAFSLYPYQFYFIQTSAW
jgi:hypothetical protein